MRHIYKNYTLSVLLMLALFLPSIANAKCQEGYICSKTLTMFGQVENKEVPFFNYVNPKAPKGGEIRFGVTGTFDSLNPFLLKGVPAAGVSLIYDSLMTSNNDDLFTRYGLLAESVKMAVDKKSIIFVLDKKAKWHDGKPVVADDVVWTYNTLLEKGNPFYKAYYRDVEKVEKINDREVKFTFKNAENRELPFVVGELTILPKHYYENRKFDEVTLEAPLGSGAYKVGKIDAGRAITYERVPDYWGNSIAYNAGLNNFDKMTYEYYRDETVSVEALKAGDYDIRQENIARVWATAYEIDAVKDGRMIKQEIPHDMATGMQAFVPNLRKERFQDERVRKALALAFDFEWSNKTLFYSSYTRTRSYFSNSIYEATGLPTGKELEILNKFKDKLPKEVFIEEYNPPVSDGSGLDRKNLLAAKNLLEEAGWKIVDGKLTNAKGEVFNIEFLLDSSTFERIIEPYISNLKKLGIQAQIRTVDPAQYIKRVDDFDFDMLARAFSAGAVPGNELVDIFGSASADVQGSGNVIGIKNPVIDELIEEILKVKDKETLIATTKALDRVLTHAHYIVPHWNITKFRIVHWNKFGKPANNPKYSLGVGTWWSLDAEKPAESKSTEVKK
jgi:microcin C transport system substrate-binding protein